MPNSNTFTLLSEDGDKASFTNDLPYPLATYPPRSWEACLNWVSLLPIFRNMPDFETCGPHFYAFECDNLMKTMKITDDKLDDGWASNFPSEIEVQSRFWVQERRLDIAHCLDGTDHLIEVLNDLFIWDDFARGDGRKIKFDLTQGGGVQITGDGKVVLLISKKVMDWIGIAYEGKDMVRYGLHKGRYFVFDCSMGEKKSLQGTNKTALLPEPKLPSRISIQASFDFGGWNIDRLATIPFAESVMSTGDSEPVTFLHHIAKVREYVSLGLDSPIHRVKIRLVDEKGNVLRLAKSSVPTLVNITVKEVDTLMDGYSVRASGGWNEDITPRSEFRIFFNRPVSNTSGRLQLALHSIFIPSAIKDVTDDQDEGTRIDFKLPSGRRGEIGPLKPGLFTSSRKLVGKLYNLFSQATDLKASIGLDTHGAARIWLDDGVEMFMGKKLAIILGLVSLATDHSRRLRIVGDVTGVDKVDVSRLTPPIVALHCSAVDCNIVMNNRSTDIVSLIPTHKRSGRFGELITHDCSRPIFHNVRGDHMANMLVSIKTIGGERLSFFPSSEEVHVNFMFRHEDQ